ncbi:MAG: hypothetical protein HC780_24180 [Leptolyngbyaceae cyanobacterium CSU_1_3]|nr:hypothetical protein [Leptolyngbyaceae cyanobacterium CSU_1_3]
MHITDLAHFTILTDREHILGGEIDPMLLRLNANRPSLGLSRRDYMQLQSPPDLVFFLNDMPGMMVSTINQADDGSVTTSTAIVGATTQGGGGTFASSLSTRTQGFLAG